MSSGKGFNYSVYFWFLIVNSSNIYVNMHIGFTRFYIMLMLKTTGLNVYMSASSFLLKQHDECRVAGWWTETQGLKHIIVVLTGARVHLCCDLFTLNASLFELLPKW